MNHHFEKNGVLVFKLTSLFDFITSSDLNTDEDKLEFIEKMKDETMDDPDSEKDKQMFLLYRVPTSLMNMTLEMIEEKLAEMKEDMNSEIFWRFLGLEGMPKEEDLQDSESSDEEDDVVEGEQAKGEGETQKVRGDKKLTRKELDDPFRGMDKAQRKKLVKEKRKEQIETKIPKKKKKLLIKKTKGQKK